MTSIEQAMQSMGVRARAAFNAVRTTPAAARTAALYAMADAELTAGRVLALARDTERRILGVESHRPLFAIPHLLN